MSVNKKEAHSFIIVDPELCTGCETCESVCSFVHDGEFNPMNSRIQRIRIEPVVNLCLSCQKCEDAPCVKVCPRDALSQKDFTGTIIIDEDKCDGCGFCAQACDFGAINMHTSTKKVVICDLCEGMKPDYIDTEDGKPTPQCIEVCPKEAVSLKSIKQIGQETRLEAVKRLMETQIKEYESPE